MYNNKIIQYKIVLFVIVLELITNYGNTLLALLIFFLVIGLLVKNMKQNFKYLVLLFLISDDQSRFLSDSFLSSNLSTIYTIPNLNMFIIIFIMLVISLIYMMKGKIYFLKEMKILVYFYLFILFTGIIIGLEYIVIYPRIAMQDMSYFINSLTFLLVMFLIYRNETKNLNILLKSIITAISVKFIILLILFVTGSGEVVGSMVKVTGESGKSLLPLYSTIFLLLIIVETTYRRYIYVFMLIVSILLTFSVASRSSMLFIVIAFVISILLLNISKVKKINFILISTIAIFIGITAIELLHPNAINNILWKLTSFGEIDLDAKKFSSLSAITRFIEILNIFYQHIENYTLLLGAGFGSYFTDKHVPFPFPIYGISAYKDEWVMAGTLFKPHTTPIFLFLKIGLGGVILYYYIYLKIFLNLKPYIVNVKGKIEYVFSIAILANIALLITKNYSSKMQIAVGIYLAIAFLLLKQDKKNESN